MKKLLLLTLAAVAAALAIAPAAGAVIYVEGSGEPAFTNTTTNTQWVRWQGSSSYATYKVEFDYYEGSQFVKTVAVPVSANGSGVMYANWQGIRSPLVEGTTYTICAYGRYTIDGSIGSRDTGSCFDADQTGRRASTTIDRTKPAIAVKIDNGAPYSSTAKLNYHIDYADNLAFPFPANFICRDIGSDPATACASETHQFNEACSVPLGGMKKVTYFNCNEDLSSYNLGDKPVTLCVVAADGAIPDNPNGSNQAQNAATANISNRVCDSITLDQTAPALSIGASATTTYAGDLVSFTAQASDATSGLSGSYAWTWGDNTAGGSGASTSHSFTQVGTYEVAVTTKDNAGNETVAKKVITVSARPTGGGTNNGGGTNGGGTSNGGGTPPATGSGAGGAVTPAPTQQEIIKSAGGGGGVQETAVAGLEVLAPKKVKLTPKTKAVSVALTAETAGRATLALVRAGKIHAQGAASITAAGTFGYKLRLPKKAKPGAYRLKISFQPAGAPKATTKTVKITLSAAKKARRASVARAASSSVARVSAAGAPVGLPGEGTVPARGTSRQVKLPVR